MYGYIYMTSFDNGRYKYIGQKKSNEFLGTKYLGSGGDYFQKVKSKYYDTAEVVLIEECDSKESLNDREKYWIKYYNATVDESFLNIHEGGKGGCTTRGYNEEQYKEYCKRMSESKSGKTHIMRQETRDKISAALKGKPKSESHREFIRTMNIGRKHTKEQTAKFIAKMTGEGNPCYGKKLMNNGIVQKYVAKEDIEEYISNGWSLGVIKNAN